MVWERIDERLETGFYTKLLVNPDNNAILYLATKGGGVFKSINAGQDWFPVNNGIEGQYIDWIVMDPQNSEVLYANSGRGIYKSINGGRSWEGAGARDGIIPMMVQDISGSTPMIPKFFINTLIFPGFFIAALMVAGAGVTLAIICLTERTTILPLI